MDDAQELDSAASSFQACGFGGKMLVGVNRRFNGDSR
jgi:hypothetical protein